MRLDGLVLSGFSIQNIDSRLSAFGGECLWVDHLIFRADIWYVVILVYSLPTSGHRCAKVNVLLAVLKLRIYSSHATKVFLLLLNCWKSRCHSVRCFKQDDTFLFENLAPKTCSLFIDQWNSRRSIWPSKSNTAFSGLFVMVSLWLGRIPFHLFIHGCELVSYSSLVIGAIQLLERKVPVLRNWSKVGSTGSYWKVFSCNLFCWHLAVLPSCSGLFSSCNKHRFAFIQFFKVFLCRS